MRAFHFREEVLAEIRHDRYHHSHPRGQRKMEVLWRKSRGLTHAGIAAFADLWPRSVQRYLDEYQQGVSHQVVRVSNHASLNAPSVCALLQEVATTGRKGPVTLVLDNARYQKCAAVQALAASLGIEWLYLPSYASNLHLIERLWKFVKRECLGCRVLPT